MKYIVFKTVNKLNGKFYVGIHETDVLWDGYLGDGITTDKPISYTRRKTPLQYAVAKYGVKNFRRYTLKEFDNLKEAQKLLKLIKYPGFLNNPLVYNIEDPDLENVYEFDLKGKLINQLSYVPLQLKPYIFDVTPFKDKMFSLIRCNAPRKRDGIRQYTKSGYYIRSYRNSKEAAKVLDLDRREILNAISKKKSVAGYYFLLETESIQNYPPNKRQRKIYQFYLNGVILREWQSTQEIKDQLKFCKGRIERAIKNRKPFKGYYWSEIRYDNYLEENPELQSKKAIKVYQYSLDKQFIKEWESISKCRKEFPDALKVCLGELESSKNYIFSFNKLMI